HGNPQGMRPDATRSTARGTGPALFFARYLRKYVDRPIGVIGVATGRSLPKVWDPDLRDKARTFSYSHMVQWIKQAGGYGNLKGMVWYQGESDAQEFPSDSQHYEQNLAKLVDRLRRDTGNPELPVIVVQICRVVTNVLPGLPGKSGGGEEMADAFATYSRAWEAVREAQRRFAAQGHHVYLVSAADLYPMSDPIHLDFEAFQRLGPRIGEVALSQVYQLPGHATPIALESLELTDTLDDSTHQPIRERSTIRVRFRGVNGRLHAQGNPSGFELRFPGISPERARASVPVIYRVDFDPADPAVVLLRTTGGIVPNLNTHLVYGGGTNPACNIADDRDIPLPAFGPLRVPG
ncbi:MAG TPA: sialate O-acetylesterase, partial [Isosphaeraceae bacterium]|nr:sialate O-acetylesterase [Isosphaeraceae bacterium]